MYVSVAQRSFVSCQFARASCDRGSRVRPDPSSQIGLQKAAWLMSNWVERRKDPEQFQSE